MPRIYHKKTKEERQTYYLEKYGEKLLNLARKRYQRGAKMTLVAKAINWDRSHVYQLVHLFGWKRNPNAKPPNFKKAWTLADQTTLRKLLEANSPMDRIIKIMGRTRHAVMKARTELPFHVANYSGEGYKWWLPAEEKQLKTLWPKEIPVENIARILGRSRMSVYIHATKLGLRRARRLRKWTPTQDQRLHYLRCKGKTWEQIAFHLNRTEKACKERHIAVNKQINKAPGNNAKTITTASVSK